VDQEAQRRYEHNQRASRNIWQKEIKDTEKGGRKRDWSCSCACGGSFNWQGSMTRLGDEKKLG